MALIKRAKTIQYGRMSLRQDVDQIRRIDEYCKFLNRTRDEVASELFAYAMDTDKDFLLSEGKEVTEKKPTRQAATKTVTA